MRSKTLPAAAIDDRDTRLRRAHREASDQASVLRILAAGLAAAQDMADERLAAITAELNH